jgi:hypothetical protein
MQRLVEAAIVVPVGVTAAFDVRRGGYLRRQPVAGQLLPRSPSASSAQL